MRQSFFRESFFSSEYFYISRQSTAYCCHVYYSDIKLMPAGSRLLYYYCFIACLKMRIKIGGGQRLRILCIADQRCHPEEFMRNAIVEFIIHIRTGIFKPVRQELAFRWQGMSFGSDDSSRQPFKICVYEGYADWQFCSYRQGSFLRTIPYRFVQRFGRRIFLVGPGIISLLATG